MAFLEAAQGPRSRSAWPHASYDVGLLQEAAVKQPEHMLLLRHTTSSPSTWYQPGTQGRDRLQLILSFTALPWQLPGGMHALLARLHMTDLSVQGL